MGLMPISQPLSIYMFNGLKSVADTGGIAMVSAETPSKKIYARAAYN